MKDQFSKEVVNSTSRSYISVTFKPTTNISSVRLKMNANQWCSDEKSADAFIEKFLAIKIFLHKLKAVKKFPYNIELMLLTYMQVIESISSGIDVRSKLNNGEIANLILDGYEKKFSEANQFCQNTIKIYEDGGKDETYTKHWKDYDKHNELVDEYQFDLRKFKDGDFKTNLESIKNSANELLEMLIAENKK
jgi:hypothetical protein